MDYSELVQRYVNHNTLEILTKAKACDSIQFFEGVLTKLQYSVLDFDALSSIEKKLTNDLELWRRRLVTEGSISVFPDDTVQYFCHNITTDKLINKLSYNIFHYLHGVFDISAQFINAALLSKSKDLDNVSFKKIQHALKKYPEYNNIREFIETIYDSILLTYIDDFNNINKHQYNLDLISSYDISYGTVNTKIPKFIKGDNVQMDRCRRHFVYTAGSHVVYP